MSRLPSIDIFSEATLHKTYPIPQVQEEEFSEEDPDHEDREQQLHSIFNEQEARKFFAHKHQASLETGIGGVGTNTNLTLRFTDVVDSAEPKLATVPSEQTTKFPNPNQTVQPGI